MLGRTIGLALLALAFITLAEQARAQQGDVRGVHDPAVIKADGVFCLFSTGRGIPIRSSTDLVHWKRVGRVFEELPAWATEKVPGATTLWAPDILFFNGRYHLYYSVSTFGSNRSCIGLATSPTLDSSRANYHWTDQGVVISSAKVDPFNAIDPNVVLDSDGAPWLSFGSFFGGVQLMRLDAKSGKPTTPVEPPIRIAARPESPAIEAPFIVRHEGFYYLFVSFDFCCKGSESTYNVVVGRSERITGPYLDAQGKPLLEGGGTPVLAGAGSVRGPGHNAILEDDGRAWFLHHFYDANAKGVPTLQIRPLSWDPEQGFPRVQEPIGATPEN